MGKRIRIFIFTFSTILMLGGVLQAEDLNTIADGFYNGLAEIIERNMNAPDNCVTEVDNYFQANQATVRKIREISKKPMEQAMDRGMAIMEKYKSMSEEELGALQRQAEQKAEKMRQVSRKRSPGATRYSDAMKEFTRKHPQHAMRIVGKTMQLMPGFAGK